MFENETLAENIFIPNKASRSDISIFDGSFNNNRIINFRFASVNENFGGTNKG